MLTITVTITAETRIHRTPDGSVPVHIWRGRTASGIDVTAQLVALTADRAEDAERFERELPNEIEIVEGRGDGVDD